MITLSDGDIFESGCSVIVCPVNVRGVLGAGLAKLFAARYPERCDKYRQACSDGTLQPGGIFVEDSAAPIIVFAATKDAWWKPSKISWVASCCSLLARVAVDRKWAGSIGVPGLGAGLGQLPWEAVYKEMDRFLSRGAVQFIVFRPKGLPALDKTEAIW